MSATSPMVRKVSATASEHYARLEALRRRQREELATRLHELRASLTPAETVEVNDIEALSDNCSSAGIGAAIVEITSRTLQGIERALQRLHSGRYGVCSECGAVIPAARLRAMPFAERCRDCQELLDACSMVLAG